MNKLKNNKILKRIIIAVIILLLLIIVATIGIGNYFVNYALARSGDGGDRKIKSENTVVEVSTEAENIIDTNKEKAEQEAQEWSKKVESKSVEIKADDNITLRGNEYINNKSNNNWIIVLHGYRSTPKSVLPIGQKFYENGYNVLVPSMRGCDESDGNYIGMGWLDKEDLKKWISLITNEYPNSNIILNGSSMGAATVLMTSGDQLSSNVKAIIEDSGYTSVWDIFASEAKARFNLPSFPILNMFEIVANFRAGYDIRQASALEQVKKATIPILFIHGTDDNFVPKYMCDQLYDAANCEKDKLIIDGAGHCESKYKEPTTYYNKVFEFANKYVENSINNNSSEENKSDELLKKYTDEKDKEATATENKILEIAKKYSPKEMNTIMEKLDGKSIYSENIELEYEFDNLILDILETKNIDNDEKETLIDYMEQEYGNVKSNPELFKRIEDVCKINK